MRDRYPSESWLSGPAWDGSARTPCSSGPTPVHFSSSDLCSPTSQLPLDDSFELDRCGSCTRCLDACPTDAFVEPRLLDATRCISYLTIEQKGPIPDELAERFQGYAFGCDICNDVCPWNQRFAQPTNASEFQPTAKLSGAGPEFFERMTEEEFSGRFGDTPFERPGLAGMRRNFRAAYRSAGEPVGLE